MIITDVMCDHRGVLRPALEQVGETTLYLAVGEPVTAAILTVRDWVPGHLEVEFVVADDALSTEQTAMLEAREEARRAR